MTAHLFRLRWYTVFFLLGLLVLCTCFAGQIQAELQTAVNRCLTVIIPSLYAMMILSQLFLESGAWQALGTAASPVQHRPCSGCRILILPCSCSASSPVIRWEQACSVH